MTRREPAKLYPLLLETGESGPRTDEEREAYDAGQSGALLRDGYTARESACHAAGVRLRDELDQERAWHRRNRGKM